MFVLTVWLLCVITICVIWPELVYFRFLLDCYSVLEISYFETQFEKLRIEATKMVRSCRKLQHTLTFLKWRESVSNMCSQFHQESSKVFWRKIGERDREGGGQQTNRLRQGVAPLRLVTGPKASRHTPEWRRKATHTKTQACKSRRILAVVL